MKSKLLIVSIAIAAFLAAMVLYPRAPRTASTSPVVTEMATTAPAAPPLVTSAVGSSAVPGKLPDRQPLSSVRNLTDLERMFATSIALRGQNYSELQGAIAYCGSLKGQLQHPSAATQEYWKTEKGKRVFEAASRFSRSFCTLTQQSSDQLLADAVQNLPTEDLVVQASVLTVGERGDVEMAIANRLASQAQSPAALEMASEYMLSIGEEIPAMRQVRRPASLVSAESRSEAQRLAVRMVTCEVRGGCGQGGLYHALWCSKCDPWVSLEQTWQRQHSPEAIQFARDVAKRIMSQDAPAQPR